MVKQVFVTTKMYTAKGYLDKNYLKYKEKVDKINLIIDEYSCMDFRITVRQLYYQLVTKNAIANEQTEYRKISKFITKARMRGDVDWDMIEDRLRVVDLPYYYHSTMDAITDTSRTYKLDRQKGQPNYIEVWAEKDAISNILSKITRYYHIRLVINRGYTSSSAMYKAYDRLKYEISMGRPCVILYLGDHDPSGEDMVYDIRKRLVKFGIHAGVEVKKIGLTWEQIQQYQPPENPLKEKEKTSSDFEDDEDNEDDPIEFRDPRGLSYYEKFGNRSWEVDALRPDVIDSIVRSEIESLIDIDKFEMMLNKESEGKTALNAVGAFMELHGEEKLIQILQDKSMYKDTTIISDIQLPWSQSTMEVKSSKQACLF